MHDMRNAFCSVATDALTIAVKEVVEVQYAELAVQHIEKCSYMLVWVDGRLCLSLAVGGCTGSH